MAEDERTEMKASAEGREDHLGFSHLSFAYVFMLHRLLNYLWH